MPPVFYVVGKSKFALLFVATSGFYFFYWMYRNWKRYRAVTDNKVWPLVRGMVTFFPNRSPDQGYRSTTLTVANGLWIAPGLCQWGREIIGLFVFISGPNTSP